MYLSMSAGCLAEKTWQKFRFTRNDIVDSASARLQLVMCAAQHIGSTPRCAAGSEGVRSDMTLQRAARQRNSITDSRWKGQGIVFGTDQLVTCLDQFRADHGYIMLA